MYATHIYILQGNIKGWDFYDDLELFKPHDLLEKPILMH